MVVKFNDETITGLMPKLTKTGLSYQVRFGLLAFG